MRNTRICLIVISFREDDPILLMNRVLPELKPVLFWMSSALEMLHYLQCNLSNYLLKREQVTTSKEALLTADEELLTVLEEVIMFTFQQTVYHLTKVIFLYYLSFKIITSSDILPHNLSLLF